MSNQSLGRRQGQSGASMIELLVVLAVITILTGFSIFYLTAHQKLYKPDDEALLLGDMLQEGRQRSLSERRTIRFEINLTNNTASLYDEGANSGVATDDVLIRKIALYSTTDVKVGSRPNDITYNPPEPLPVPTSVFKSSVYPPSISQNVCTIRFMSNGTVTDAGTNSVGAGAVVTGVTIPIWSPTKATPTNSDIARALTIIGSTGTIRLWEFDKNSTASNKWRDARRNGSY